ncbi:hypothetical protein BDZ89DRAFT_1124496 [Hymenopellis radicata]|nr:hypothetical protein BDZ89DRAFT_1124496 [Hymenopellis radicata]
MTDCTTAESLVNAACPNWAVLLVLLPPSSTSPASVPLVLSTILCQRGCVLGFAWIAVVLSAFQMRQADYRGSRVGRVERWNVVLVCWRRRRISSIRSRGLLLTSDTSFNGSDTYAASVTAPSDDAPAYHTTLRPVVDKTGYCSEDDTRPLYRLVSQHGFPRLHFTAGHSGEANGERNSNDTQRHIPLPVNSRHLCHQSPSLNGSLGRFESSEGELFSFSITMLPANDVRSPIEHCARAMVYSTSIPAIVTPRRSLYPSEHRARAMVYIEASIDWRMSSILPFGLLGHFASRSCCKHPVRVFFRCGSTKPGAGGYSPHLRVKIESMAPVITTRAGKWLWGYNHILPPEPAAMVVAHHWASTHPHLDIAESAVVGAMPLRALMAPSETSAPIQVDCDIGQFILRAQDASQLSSTFHDPQLPNPQEIPPDTDHVSLMSDLTPLPSEYESSSDEDSTDDFEPFDEDVEPPTKKTRRTFRSLLPMLKSSIPRVIPVPQPVPPSSSTSTSSPSPVTTRSKEKGRKRKTGADLQARNRRAQANRQVRRAEALALNDGIKEVSRKRMWEEQPLIEITTSPDSSRFVTHQASTHGGQRLFMTRA